jgi:hypothetical protein
MKYNAPVTLDKTTTVRAIAIDKIGNKSSAATATFYKFPNDWSVQLNSKYDKQYSAGGDEGIIDGIRGNENWRKGEWQGYQSQNFEVVIDLKKTKTITEVGGSFLQDTRAWIIMPTQFEVEFSTDGKTFKKVGEINNTFPAEDYTVKMQDLKIACKEQCRFVKLRAINFGKLPEWHQGHPFNGEAYIFVDEVWVK